MLSDDAVGMDGGDVVRNAFGFGFDLEVLL